MIYLDTSVVVAMLTAEEHSNEAIGWFEQCTTRLISCDWLITETRCALALKQHLYGLSATDGQAAARQFDRLLQAGLSIDRWGGIAFAMPRISYRSPHSVFAPVTLCT